jgi:hypothetical protein
MKMSATRRLQLSRGFSAVVFCSIAATHLAAAQNAPGPNNAAPPMTSPNENAAAGLADWRGQMVDRIKRSMSRRPGQDILSHRPRRQPDCKRDRGKLERSGVRR